MLGDGAMEEPMAKSSCACGKTAIVVPMIEQFLAPSEEEIEDPECDNDDDDDA